MARCGVYRALLAGPEDRDIDHAWVTVEQDALAADGITAALWPVEDDTAVDRSERVAAAAAGGGGGRGQQHVRLHGRAAED